MADCRPGILPPLHLYLKHNRKTELNPFYSSALYFDMFFFFSVDRETPRYFPRNHVRIEDYKKNYCWRILFNSLWIYTITSVRTKSKANGNHQKEDAATSRISTLWEACTEEHTCVSKNGYHVKSSASTKSPDPSSQELLFFSK